jgi:hypothetical protein
MPGLGSKAAPHVKDPRPRDFDGDKCASDWDTADMTTAVGDVRFRGKAEHLEMRRQCPLMTQTPV